MPKLVIIALIAVAAVATWVWLRRRHMSGKPLVHNRRSDKQPPSKDTQENHRTDVGLQTPVATDECQDQSIEDTAAIQK